MNMPLIRKTYFECEEDREANSIVLDAIFKKILKVEYNPVTASFASSLLDGPWAIHISDWHDGEKKPHYELEVGSDLSSEPDDFETYCAFLVKYCDYNSTLEGGPSIDLAPGHYSIEVRLSAKEEDALANLIAKDINRAYLASLRKAFPCLYVLASDLMPIL
ncbi:MAG: hypothetical protein K5837_04265 [Candidatus Saccharibacteria bacterium]|nr:hypothetical protein [Candidatus Saccharibacteria bacterium]